MRDFFEAPILNSPYAAPTRHWALDGEGRPTGRVMDSRRRAEFGVAMPRLEAERQADLPKLDDPIDEAALQTAIGEMRAEVDWWRSIPNPLDWKVTPETRRLLLHWRDPAFEGLRPFFCQVEPAEIAIWLAEVAPRRARSQRFLERLRGVNEAANPGLFRVALKLATGAGKTTVMAMLIAWQTINAVRYQRTRSFSKGFLVVTPGPFATGFGSCCPTTPTATIASAAWFRPTCSRI